MVIYNCWHGIVFFSFLTIQVFVMRISQFLIALWYLYLIISYFPCHSVQYTMQKPSYLYKSCPNLNVIENGVDPNNITRIQRCCNLDISTKYHHLSGTTNLILAIKTSIPLLMLIPCIKTHTTIHHTNTGVYSE